jgi:hypothetical protein
LIIVTYMIDLTPIFLKKKKKKIMLNPYLNKKIPNNIGINITQEEKNQPPLRVITYEDE